MSDLADYVHLARIADRHGRVHLARASDSPGFMFCGYGYAHPAEEPGQIRIMNDPWMDHGERVCPACARMAAGGPARPSPNPWSLVTA